MNAVAYAPPPSFTGSNNPEMASLITALHGQFREAANGLSKGIKDVTLHAEQIVAILFLINRNAMDAPGLNQTYSAEVGQAKGNIFGAKLFNYALSKVEPSTRENIDMMFGNVKAQMCQALDQLIHTYTSPIAPTLTDVLGVIERSEGIKGLGMAHMYRKGAERQLQRQQEEANTQILREHERKQREVLAVSKGFATYDDYVVDENRKAEDARTGKALGYLAGRAEVIATPESGYLYIVVDGSLCKVNAEDQKKILTCVAATI